MFECCICLHIMVLINLSHWQLLVVLSIYIFVHYHHIAAPIILWSCVLLVVGLRLQYLQFVLKYWNFLLALNLVDIYLVWYCYWFFAVGLFSCRCLVDLPGVKTLLMTIQQHQLLKGLDYHHRHLKTPMRIGSELRLPHTSTQTFFTSQLL